MNFSCPRLLNSGLVKVKLCPCFNWTPRHEGMLGEWRYSSTHSLTSVLDGCEWSASRPGRFTHRKNSPWYPLDRRLGGPQSQSGRGGEEKKSHPLIIHPVAHSYTTEPTRLHATEWAEIIVSNE
jgi:hypothetical protein